MENNFKLEVSEHFNNSVETLYTAWTDEKHLKRWWKPMETLLTEYECDLKKGGTVKYVFDSGLSITGVYNEVEKNKLLDYTWNWHFPEDDVKDASYQLSITFKEESEGSSIHVLQMNIENEEGILLHKQGWEKGLNDLKQYLETLKIVS